MQFDEVESQCPCCGEPISVPVDPSQGTRQSFIEDCAVCCRPLQIQIRLDPETLEADVEVTPS